ncbi:MAG: iron-sulfur cluster assembly scaffold protein [Methanomassiliicoccales archaeon]|jgi:nitrogen fixation NifU-like protein|nr:iron-sulfur cluster assembly scaffold protein [Methanomassiliicoccales archaeon]
MAYGRKVMEHFANPRNVGEMKDADGVGRFGNTVDGDEVVLYIKVKDDVISDISFQVFGCAAAIASTSMFTEMVKGKSLEAAIRLTKEDVSEALDGLPPGKIGCSVIAPDALRAAINDYLGRRGRGFITGDEIPPMRR